MTAVYRCMADYCRSIGSYAPSGSLDKAADEIEALRAENTILKKQRDAHLRLASAIDHNVTRKRAEECDELLNRIRDMEEDNDQLRVELADLRDAADDHLPGIAYLSGAADRKDVCRKLRARVAELHDELTSRDLVIEGMRALDKWTVENTAALEALIEGRAAVVPLELSNQNLVDTGTVNCYDYEFYGDRYSHADDDHREWWDLAVRVSRLDKPVEDK